MFHNAGGLSKFDVLGKLENFCLTLMDFGVLFSEPIKSDLVTDFRLQSMLILLRRDRDA